MSKTKNTFKGSTDVKKMNVKLIDYIKNMRKKVEDIDYDLLDELLKENNNIMKKPNKTNKKSNKTKKISNKNSKGGTSNKVTFY